MTFKKQLKNTFIPQLERMLKKEEDHYDYLLKHANGQFTINCSKSIGHLSLRIKEYKDYLKNETKKSLANLKEQT